MDELIASIEALIDAKVEFELFNATAIKTKENTAYSTEMLHKIELCRAHLHTALYRVLP